MSNRDIIVIGASAGGVDALIRLCAQFPADLPASVFVAQHLSATARSVLPQLLDRAGPLPARSPADGKAIERGRIYVAPPDRHLLVRPGKVLVRRGPFENRARPAVNPLFRSAAIAYGGQVIGVVLTGLLDDGTDGLIAIKAAGGVSVIQEPDDELSRGEAGPTIPLRDEYVSEDEIAAQEFAALEPERETPGQHSALSCPDCGGVLNVIELEDEVRFRCQVGHAFTPIGLASAQTAELERALAVAIRTHRDRIRLFAQMTDRAKTRGLPHALA